MDEQNFETPDLSMMSNDDICALMLATGMSNDPSDKAFCKACRDELAKRKPQPPAALRPYQGGEK